MKVDAALPCTPGLVQTRVADYLQLVRPRRGLQRRPRHGLRVRRPPPRPCPQRLIARANRRCGGTAYSWRLEE